MKYTSPIDIFGSMASIVALGLLLYFQFIVPKVPTLEILTISNEILTSISNEHKFTVDYKYDNNPVENLSKIRFVVQNVGTKTIIGSQNGDLLEDVLRIKLKENKTNNQVYKTYIVNTDFPVDLVQDSTGCNLRFKQWKTNEFVEIIAYIGNNNKSVDKNLTSISVNDRDIIDGTIRQSIYKSGKKESTPKIIDTFNSRFRKALWWLAIMSYSLLLLASIPSLVSFLKNDEDKSTMGRLLLMVYWFLLCLVFASPLLWMIEI